ncbi:MAG: hypothetical protein M1166_05040 [Candidatus Thermoplasmatota archaeon]|jgi:hypothetical protein|nr:hypothetical protein [Candidatus Thermoplasmatota archaeon]
MVKKEIEFQFERDTKNTYRFQEAGDNPVIGTLYVKKSVFKKEPKKIKVAIEWEE